MSNAELQQAPESEAAASAPPGWYPDAAMPWVKRYWDGQRWLDGAQHEDRPRRTQRSFLDRARSALPLALSR